MDSCCALGHELIPANRNANGGCRSCMRGRGYSYIHGLNHSWRVEADIYYRLIKMGKGDLNRKDWSLRLRRRIYPPGYQEATD